MSEKNFTIYKSSAGSGKTFTLVKEYLALALNDPNDPPQAYKHILAITFTNKAANEMKERIIKALKELSADDHSTISGGSKTLLNILKEHKKLNTPIPLTDEIIRERAKRVLSSILHNYSDFAIGTIDSFVHKVVRTFAFDLKIPMSFDIEMDDDKLLSQAIDLLIAQTGSNELLTKVLIEFTENKADDEKSWHIESDLKEFAKNLLTEEGTIYIEKLKELSIDDFFKIKETLNASIKQFENELAGLGKKAIELIIKAGLTSKEFYQSDKGIYKYFERLSQKDISKIAPNSYVKTTVGEDKWAGGKVSKENIAAIESIKSQLHDLFNSIQIIKENRHSEYILFQLINRNIYSLAVLNEIEKLMMEYKAENNILHISEFNKMIAKIVLNEPIPFIYERLGERYNNYLIDEFQDTSVLQFQNLLPLIDNSLASGHFTMLVGDGKQAIYRWRGGEVEQFAVLPKVFAHNDNPLVLEREAALERNHNPQVLKNNFRSKREIIEFNNDLFRTLSGKLNAKYQSIYNDLEQGFNPENTGGFVQVEFIEQQKDEFKEYNKQRTLELIHELQKDNYQLKDIAVLVRKNTDGSEIANYLTERGIEVISSDSLLLNKSTEINFIYSLLKYLANNADIIVHAEIVEYLIAKKYIIDQDLNSLLKEKASQEMNKLIQSVAPEFNYHQLAKIPVYELCETLIRLFRLNEKPNAYIQFFLDEVLNYTLKKNNNLNDFLEYWSEKKDKVSLIVPQGINAVRIMSIHRSKGLEFPVVILPFSHAQVKKGKDNLWIDLENEKLHNLPSAIVPTSKDLLETPFAELYEEEENKTLLDSLNVLYVALTRPEERLYILTGKQSAPKDKINSVTDMFSYYYTVKEQLNPGQNIYTFGEAQAHQQKHESAPSNNFELKSFNSNQWRDSIKMRTAAPSIWNTNISETKKDHGVKVHTALARIISVDDIPTAVESMFQEGLIDQEEQKELLQTLPTLLSKQELKPYFEKGLIVKNEMEIITASGKIFRPDRIVIKDKTAAIIDYKTGEEKREHKQQVQDYADLLHQMGYTVTEKLLIYIEKEKIVYA
ncbi:MAG: UvrD-helicase domain-containing protein [Bacteroidetes bacterium]|nr:UvrD-helicase domain-containing protein [Bacteroidota bacterium]